MAEKKKFLLRVDPRLHETLERWAADELRSVNAQIEFLLAEAARRAGRIPKDKADLQDGVAQKAGQHLDRG
jgi:hypothetical protein